jgi:hypothetical protein
VFPNQKINWELFSVHVKFELKTRRKFIKKKTLDTR